MPLELEQARDRGEGDFVVRQPELATDFLARSSWLQERVGVHATVNRLELVGPSHTGRQGLRGHRVADADNGVTPPGRPPFQSDVQAVLQWRLERSKRHPVDRVDDRRHLLVPGRGSAEDARLGAVGMNDLRLKPSKGRAEATVRLQVDDGPDRPDQIRKQLNFEAQLRRAVEQIAFRPLGRAGDQRHIVMKMVVKTRDAQERILLGAADDQPRDDMDDSHGWSNSSVPSTFD